MICTFVRGMSSLKACTVCVWFLQGAQIAQSSFKVASRTFKICGASYGVDYHSG